MKLSVIVPYHKASLELPSQLRAMASQKWEEDWEVIIANNGPLNEVYEVVRPYLARLPKLRIVDALDRPGPGHARNAGARAARGEFLAFCDADDIVDSGWVSAVGNALAKYEFVASRVEFERLNPPWVVRAFRDHPQQTGLSPSEYPPYLPHAGASGLGVRRTLHEKVRGFDENLPVLEDTDYCFRTQLQGTTLRFVPEALVHVRCRQRLSGLFDQTRSWAQWNVFLFQRYRPADLRLHDTWRTYVRTWHRLLRELPQVRSPDTRIDWVRQLAWQVGAFQGSIRFRSPPVLLFAATGRPARPHSGV
ncbi:MAG: glycosyltransferase family 2 protein [Chloroflexi bacterium]|nr:glycosyltransferase family 2 protein [Chloroflexota bacterium]